MGWLAAAWWALWATVTVLFEEHKLARRVLLFWSMWLITVVALRATQPEVLIALGGMAAGTIVTGIIGLLATVTAFYVKSREREDRRNDDST